MAVTVTRDAGGGRGRFNQGGQKSDTVRYTVQGLEVRALKQLIAKRQQGTIGLPNYEDDHPELPNNGMLARDIAVVEEITGDVASVDVTYTTSNVNQTGLLYAVPDTSGTQFVWDETFEDVEVNVPVAYRVFETVSDGTTSQELPRWEVKPTPVAESRVVKSARWTIGGGVFDANMRLAFEGEHDKVHTLEGERYLFRLQGIRPIDNLTYEVVCSWTRDKGTPNPGRNSSDTDRLRQPHELQYLDNISQIYPFRPVTEIIRPPFYHMETIPSPFPLTDDPDISAPWVVLIKDKIEGNINNLPELRF